MQNAHHVALEQKHATLDRKIAQEAQRPSPNSELLSELKRRKLKLKEEIAGI
ncbi:YdcH family protein [Sphingomonas sp. CJ99]